MRVALIYVGQPESELRPVMSPPIGPQLLGTLLLHHGAEVELFDSRLQPADRLLAAVDDFDPHLVGFSYLSPNADEAVALARAVRRPGRAIVAGGVHASIHTEATLAIGVFDTVVRREGESAILDLYDRLVAGEPLPPIVEGTAWPDVDTLPPYADFDCYRGVYDQEGYRPVYLQLGRGCPMQCTFCELPNRQVFEPPRRRFRTVDTVMAEVHEYVRRWGVDFVTIADPIATLNLPLLMGVVRRMDAELPDVGLMFNGHVNRFSRALAEVLGEAQAGRDREGQRITVWFGFESGSQRLLDFMRKRTSVADGLAVARLCRDHDVQVGANLLLGVPTETEDDYRAHHAFMDEIEPTFPNPNILNPLPGTEMYDYCADRGLLRDPADHSIWRDSDIAARGEGPVLGIDYQRVLATYRHYRDEPAPESEPRYRSWAADDDTTTGCG
ncbi:B12-binding domain-containing radical SAM protein [Cryptosporangium phraense]|uniref:B12-binding domain-containing radical SAM protein n=1 Tax=Cryptosporangium phraense TaxID=2593070 RepID=A0A545AU43_9ACTN|nr:radical SAM protein [Cryptosporangium phraense]TQS44856.1 B12-binding domain-containing radical SAM protein [Cryptosporangium phraense]